MTRSEAQPDRVSATLGPTGPGMYSANLAAQCSACTREEEAAGTEAAAVVGAVAGTETAKEVVD